MASAPLSIDGRVNVALYAKQYIEDASGTSIGSSMGLPLVCVMLEDAIVANVTNTSLDSGLHGDLLQGAVLQGSGLQGAGLQGAEWLEL